MSGSPVSAAPMLPHWCSSSLMRTQLLPASSERNSPVTPSMVATANTAGYDRPGAGAPKPTLYAQLTSGSAENEVPPLVDRNRPVSPATHTSPDWPGTALMLTNPCDGRPVAAGEKLLPPLVLT